MVDISISVDSAIRVVMKVLVCTAVEVTQAVSKAGLGDPIGAEAEATTVDVVKIVFVTITPSLGAHIPAGVVVAAVFVTVAVAVAVFVIVCVVPEVINLVAIVVEVLVSTVAN